MIWHYRSTCDFHIASLTCHFVHNHAIVKYLKIWRGQSLTSLVVPGRRKHFFFLFFLTRQINFRFFGYRRPPTSQSSYCYLYWRWRGSTCDHWCCLKVLLMSLKFESGCSKCCPDAFLSVMLCTVTTLMLFLFLLFFFGLFFAKYFWKALLHSLLLHSFALVIHIQKCILK